ncbi:hypothetical protein PHET_08686, partial [Paragonimus heterotremus]
MSNNPLESLSIPCTACGVCVMECEALTCENCCAVCYCSLICKQNNWVFSANPDHSHRIWCSKMKAFMLVESRICELPLSFARGMSPMFIHSYVKLATAQTNFSEQHFAHFLTAYGVFNTGLWKYECHSHVNVAPWDSVSTPGDELHLFSALFVVTSLDAAKDTAPENPYGVTFNSTLSYEDAMLRAYVLPMEAILLSIDPIITPFSGSNRQQLSLVNVHLSDWASYYVWRGLCGCQSAASTADLEQFNSPVAILLHWALTIYYILAYVLPKTSVILIKVNPSNSVDFIRTYSSTGPQTIASVLQMGKLTIHLIGVEHELSMLPVFKELHHLVRLGLEVRLYFIGTHIDPTVNRRVFHLSDRLSAIVWAGTYHDFWGTQSSHGIDLPDVIVGLNSGLSAYASWTPTLKLIHVSCGSTTCKPFSYYTIVQEA